MNVKLLRKVKRHILAEPRRLEMNSWCELSETAPCGTSACLAGWSGILSGLVRKNEGGYFDCENWSAIGAKALGLTRDEANRLFRFREQVSAKVKHWPIELSDEYNEAYTPRMRAEITAKRIDLFIRTKGKE